MIRAKDKEAITVPAESGEPVEVRIQGFALRAVAGSGGAVFQLPPLHFGNRVEVRGEVWREKAPTKLAVEKA